MRNAVCALYKNGTSGNMEMHDYASKSQASSHSSSLGWIHEFIRSENLRSKILNKNKAKEEKADSTWITCLLKQQSQIIIHKFTCQKKFITIIIHVVHT